jgi:hypothetical protein
MARPVFPIDQQYVQPAVVLVIEEGTPGTQRFRQVFLPEGSAIVVEDNAA